MVIEPLTTVRHSPPFTCMRCRHEQTGGKRCSLCGGKLADRKGRRVGGARERIYRALTPVDWVVVVLGPPMGVGALAGTAVGHAAQPGGFEPLLLVFMVLLSAIVGVVLPWYLGRHHWRARRYDRAVASMVERAFAKAGPVTAIATAGGLARVRGKVILLEGIEGPLGPAAAVREREVRDVEETAMGPDGQQSVTKRFIVEMSVGGRYAISDGTGLALVDEDVFVLWRDGGMRLHGPSGIVVGPGDEVELTGFAERADVEELRREASGYRGADRALVFKGTVGQPVVVKLLGD